MALPSKHLKQLQQAFVADFRSLELDTRSSYRAILSGLPQHSQVPLEANLIRCATALAESEPDAFLLQTEATSEQRAAFAESYWVQSRPRMLCAFEGRAVPTSRAELEASHEAELRKHAHNDSGSTVTAENVLNVYDPAAGQACEKSLSALKAVTLAELQNGTCSGDGRVLHACTCMPAYKDVGVVTVVVDEAGKLQIVHQSGATSGHGFEMWFAHRIPAPWGAGVPNQTCLESSMKTLTFKLRLMCDVWLLFRAGPCARLRYTTA